MEFNLETVKQEIEARKAENSLKEQASGRVSQSPQAKKKFLVDLLTSVNNGTPTPAVAALRNLNETTEQIYGSVGKGGSAQTYVPPVNTVQPHALQPINEMNNGMERGDAYFEQQMDKLRNKSNSPNFTPNAGLSQTLTEYANAPFIGQNQSMGGGINANALNEHVTKTMNEVMGSSNFTKIVAEAYKNMINEMYTKEKVESVLVEIVQSDTFKKIVKKQIVETLIEIQNRKKEPSK